MKIQKGYTFDDVLLKPLYSEIHPTNVELKTKITDSITLNIPIISSAMDTVTEHRLAIALARTGGIGCIHKNFSIEDQAKEVSLVKKKESLIVTSPITIYAEQSIHEARKLMQTYHISGIPVLERSGKLVGIITNRDIRAVDQASGNIIVGNIMTSNLITIHENEVTKSKALSLLNINKIERLIVVNSNYHCIGLINLKDLENDVLYPNASKDSSGRLKVAAAIGVSHDIKERATALVDAGVDLLVIDTAHGHSQGVINSLISIKTLFPNIDIIVGNIATREAAEDLIKAGANALKVGIGPGSICTTRIVAGVGVPQLTAINEVFQVAKKYNIPVIADGGIKYSGDLVKALAAGASVVMLGGMLSGTLETPGDLIFYKGASYKNYRGMGSIGAMARGSADRYFQEDIQDKLKLVPEGVEGRVPFKGSVYNVIHQVIGGVKAGMGYLGCQKIIEMQDNCEFIEISGAALAESHTYNLQVTDETPNYGVTN